MRKIFSLGASSLVMLMPALAFAQEHAGTSSPAAGYIAIASALAIGFAAFAGTLAQGKAVSAALESIGRNPGASGKLLVPMILGLAFIESLVIFSFVIAIGLSGKF